LGFCFGFITKRNDPLSSLRERCIILCILLMTFHRHSWNREKRASWKIPKSEHLRTKKAWLSLRTEWRLGKNTPLVPHSSSFYLQWMQTLNF
jgi:hypothetical protein